MIKELTVLMPCLNEEKTLGDCIRIAKDCAESLGIDYEILIVDNGSTDSSVSIAKELGARVVAEDEKGYGAALRRGIKEACGKYTIMGDCDLSYDFAEIGAFMEKLREGNKLVMGNRFAGGIMKGAMPWSHRVIGNPLISKVGRHICKCDIGDFCCGLRGFDTKAMQELCFRTTGMEFSVEMVVVAKKAGYSSANIPIKLHPDGRDRAPHLRTIKDGLRVFKYFGSVA